MASPKALPLLLCFLCFFSLFFSTPATEAAKPDFFYLTLQWPGALCNRRECCKPTTGDPAIDFFVRGLDGYDSATGNPVNNCFNSSCRFFVNNVRPFIHQMHLHWADVRCPNNNGVDLWRSKWCKYGTCSGLTQANYFQGALNLSTKFDLLFKLSFYDIVPSDTEYYKLEDIQNNLVINYGFSTVVKCRRSSWFGPYDQLSKVQFCVSADAKMLISCPISRTSNCADNVQFPTFSLDMLEPCLDSKPETSPAQKDLVM